MWNVWHCSWTTIQLFKKFFSFLRCVRIDAFLFFTTRCSYSCLIHRHIKSLSWWRITESNCCENLAKVPGYHYINPPNLVTDYLSHYTPSVKASFVVVRMGRLELPRTRHRLLRPTWLPLHHIRIISF